MNFKIVDKYIFSTVAKAILLWLFLWMVIWIAPETLVDIIKDVSNNEITIKEGIFEILYELPKVFVYIAPISTTLGTWLVFDKLSKDSELTILRSVGLSFTRIMTPVLVIGAIMGCLCFFASDKLVPKASIALGENAGYNEHFVHVQKDSEGQPKQAIIISNFTPKGINNLTVINFATDEYHDVALFKEIIFAPYANKYDDKWVLPEAYSHPIDIHGIFQEKTMLKNYTILEGESAKDVYEVMYNNTKRDRAFTNSELRAQVNLLKKLDEEDKHNFMLMKWYQRFLHPFSCVLFAALACLLGFAPPRSSRSVGAIVLAFLVFLYSITPKFFELLAEKGALPPIISAIIPTVGLLAAIYIIKKVRDL